MAITPIPRAFLCKVLGSLVLSCPQPWFLHVIAISSPPTHSTGREKQTQGDDHSYFYFLQVWLSNSPHSALSRRDISSCCQAINTLQETRLLLQSLLPGSASVIFTIDLQMLMLVFRPVYDQASAYSSDLLSPYKSKQRLLSCLLTCSWSIKKEKLNGPEVKWRYKKWGKWGCNGCEERSDSWAADLQQASLMEDWGEYTDTHVESH